MLSVCSVYTQGHKQETQNQKTLLRHNKVLLLEYPCCVCVYEFGGCDYNMVCVQLVLVGINENIVHIYFFISSVKTSILLN